MKTFTVKVSLYDPEFKDDEKYLRVYNGDTVPRAGDLLKVGDSNWEIKNVVWDHTAGTIMGLMATCLIHFHRESADAYWNKPEFWLENGFVKAEK